MLGAAASGGSGSGDRDWMNFASNQSRAPMERPTTAASNARAAHLENQLKEEKR